MVRISNGSEREGTNREVRGRGTKLLDEQEHGDYDHDRDRDDDGGGDVERILPTKMPLHDVLLGQSHLE